MAPPERAGVGSMFRKWSWALPLLLVACAAPERKEEKVVNVYTHRHYDTDKQLFADFEQKTGIHVNVVMAEDEELLSRLEAEGANGPADVISPEKLRIQACCGARYERRSQVSGPG